MGIKENFFKKTHEEKLKIKGVEINVEVGFIDHSKLFFWKENPRIIHITEELQDVLDDDRIKQELEDTEGVSELAKRIQEDGQINEALLVIEDGWVVVEGNRRLAAIKKIFKKNPSEKWIEVPIKLLPIGTKISVINQYLGDINLIGKKAWKPYNKAAFLSKELDNSYESDVNKMAKAYTMHVREIKRQVFTYRFMKKKGESDPSRYNFYELLWTNGELKKMLEQDENFGDIYVAKVRRDEFNKAEDVRSNVAKILRSKDKSLVKNWIENKLDFYDAVEKIKEKGTDQNEFNQIRIFFDHCIKINFQKNILKLPRSTQNEALRMLKKIGKIAGEIRTEIEKNKFK